MKELDDALSTKIIDQYTLDVIIQRVDFWLKNPPNMTCVNVVLSGNEALQFAITKEIIMHCANLTEQEAEWYIVMAGVNSELKKLAVLGVSPQDESKD